MKIRNIISDHNGVLPILFAIMEKKMKKYLSFGLVLVSLCILQWCQSAIVQQLTGGNTSSSTTSSSRVEMSSSTTSSTSLESSSSTGSETSTSSTSSSRLVVANKRQWRVQLKKATRVCMRKRLQRLLRDPERTVTHYAFYDIGGNGTKELFTGGQNSTGAMYGATVTIWIVCFNLSGSLWSCASRWLSRLVLLSIPIELWPNMNGLPLEEKGLKKLIN